VGESRNLQDAIARLKLVVPASLALIAVLLCVQFSTVRETFLIMALLPLSCVGGVAALTAAGLIFSVPAAIGFLALFGITVMESIILLTHFNRRRDKGVPWRAALDQAGMGRMWPVMMPDDGDGRAVDDREDVLGRHDDGAEAQEQHQTRHHVEGVRISQGELDDSRRQGSWSRSAP
jgi:AcrB/AcrD/AcrF family